MTVSDRASDERQKPKEDFMESLFKLQPDRVELWKHFQDRADKIAERLWTVGAWLMTIIGTTLSLPFAAKFVTFPESGFPIQVKAALPLACISFFGILLVVYLFFALVDMQEHISGNWRASERALNRDVEQAFPLTGAKRQAYWVLFGFGCLALAAFAVLLILACVWPQPPETVL